ncbi:MAG: hypothetical protein BHV65_08730 [Alistipes sp. 58_9_plus]|nr:MAG: hypothetical protein BHV65_08730 [Alistipes sp. 58_9_plus]
MSLIITAYTQEGIVMAADSRVTINYGVSDYKYLGDYTPKLFLLNEKIGIFEEQMKQLGFSKEEILNLLEEYRYE